VVAQGEKSMLKRNALLVAVVCAVLSLCPLLYSQANGSLSGTVADKSGSVISGATVKITSQGTGLTRDAKTDDSGHYLVPLLPVSIYTIRVEAQGFQITEQKDIRLQVDEQREVDFTINPASVSATVEVNATEVAVETTNASLGQVITSEQVADLPLNGRDFVQLATLTPGVTAETNPNSFFNAGASSEVSARGTFSLSVGGSRAQSTDWLLDNNDNNELTSGGISIFSDIDSIQEFKVLTYNYSAEYGTRAGPTVLVTTKSGANKFHGALYEYFRNTDLDAKSYFAAFKEQFNLNQFGGSIGGPIQKDKTFFFLNYEAKRQRHGIPYNGLVPTQAMQAGDFTDDPLGTPRPGTFDNSGPNADGFTDLVNPYGPTLNGGTLQSPFYCDGSDNPVVPNNLGVQTPTANPCNKIPSAMFDPVGSQMIGLYPLPNNVNTSTITNYSNVPVRRLNEGQANVRLDHTFSNKDSAFARFSYDQANSYVPGGSPTWAEQNPFASNQLIANHGRNLAISETHILSPNNINQVSVGFNRIFNFITSYGEFGPQTCEAANLGIVGADLNSQCPGAPPGLTQTTKACLSCGLSSTQIANYFSLGDRGFAPFQGGTNVYSFSDTFDMIRGKHDIRVGFGFRDNQMNVMTNGFQDGYYIMNGGTGQPDQAYGSSFTGDPEGDLLIGQVDGAIHDQTFLGATTGRRWKMFRPFVQDDWRVTNNLTLNLGVAWSLVTPITEAQNRQANFNFATGQYLIAGNVQFSGACSNCIRTDGRVGVQFDKSALEPRIGLAWKPFGSQNTVVRAGYAIYHDSAWSQGAQGTWQNPPYYAEIDQFDYGIGFPCPYGNANAGASAQNCGLKYGFTQPNLLPYTAPPNPDTFTGTILSQDLNFKQGMVQQFNLDVERQLPGNVVLTVGYAGSRSTHILIDGLNLNVGSPGACVAGGTYTLGCGPGGASFSAPYGPFTTVDNITDGGRARYDGLQIKAETKSARHGLYALIGYTWARTFDSGMPDGDGTFPGATYWPLPGTQKADWALSQINLNSQFTASVLYELPFGKGKQYGGSWNATEDAVLGGWQVNVIERATSGFPLFVVNGANGSGVNFQWNGSSLNRPDQICNPNTGHHSLTEFFNTSCFVDAPTGELGNASRTPVNGPDFVNTDFSAFKNFRIHEGYSLQFRAEMFNLFNHAQFYLGGGGTGMQDISSPSTFGVVNGTVNNPRLVQFALRLDF
jgi:Carboxypeptidase regulatory-like domain